MSTHDGQDDQTRWENKQEDAAYARRQAERQSQIAKGFSHNTAALYALYGYAQPLPADSLAGYPARPLASNLELVSLGAYTNTSQQPEYRTWFVASQADSLCLRITLQDKYFDKRTRDDPEHTYSITLKVYQPNGALFTEVQDDVHVQADWKSFYWFSSIGKRQAGKWQPGVYGVEAFVQEEPVGRHWFLIVDEADDSTMTQHYPRPETSRGSDISLSAAVPANLWFQRLAFYAHDTSNLADGDPQKFSQSFTKATTGYIGFWMEVENPYIPQTTLAQLGRLPTLYYDVETTIWYPNGRLMAKPTYERRVHPTDQHLQWHHLWGWEQLGNWTLGVYGVQVSIDNVLMISNWFKVEGYLNFFGGNWPRH